MRAAAAANPASAQRISDWKAGRNVPARFESLLPVVLTLIDIAKKRGAALPAKLADPQEWKRLWTASNSWTPDDADDSACPYLGLQSYRNTDSDIFFGRRRATEELTELVLDTARDGGGIVTLIGASGAGKSSLLAAGLSAEVARRQGNWHIVTVTPGAHPLDAVAKVLGVQEKNAADTEAAKSSGVQDKDTANTNPAKSPDAQGKNSVNTGSAKALGTADTDSTGIASAKPVGVHGENFASTDAVDAPGDDRAAATWPTDGSRLLIIDQFEELFTVCADEQERDEFLVSLDRHATQTDHVAVVLALRADFYARCLDYPVLQESLEKRSYLLGPMRVDELTEAITGPAERAGLKLEPGLDELVVTELCGLGDHRTRQSYDPGALPLLSHVMAATWQHREGRKLTIAGYRAAGGVVGSVAATAERAWSELSDPQQSAAKDVLLGLVTVARDSRDTRRIAARPALQQRSADPLSAAAALELLARTRLVTLDADSVFLTHEIVLDAWPRLRAWIDENRVGYLVRQRVEADAVEWDSTGRDPALLYRGSRLETALEHTAAADGVVRDFLHASRASRGRTRRRGTLTRIGLALAGVILLVFGLTAYTQTQFGQRQREEKDFAAVMTEAERLRGIDPSLSAQLYLVAERMRPGDTTVSTHLLGTQDQPLATIVPGHVNGYVEVTQQPRGALLASVDDEGIAYLWDNNNAQHPRKLVQLPGEISKAVFSANHRVMATSSGEGSRLWDITETDAPRMLAELPPAFGGPYVNMSFSADGNILATANSQTVTLWNVTDPARPGAGMILPAGHEVRPRVRFSPTEPVLAVLTNNRLSNEYVGRIQLWKVDGVGRTVPLGPPMETATTILADMDFSPDGRILAAGGGNGSLEPNGPLNRGAVRLWRIERDTPPAPLGAPITAGESAFHSVAFSPDSQILVVATSEYASLWNMTDPARPTLIDEPLTTSPTTCRFSNGIALPCRSGPTSLAFGAEGRTLTAGGWDGNLRVWSLPPALVPGISEKASFPRFDAAGHRAIVTSDRATGEIWDTKDPRRWRLLGRFTHRNGDHPYAVSPDGATLVTTLYGSQFTVYDISDPANVRLRGDWETSLGSANYIAIRPDWRIMVTSHDDSLRVWNIEEPGHPTPLGEKIPLAEARDIEFSGDGRILAVRTSESDGDIVRQPLTLWDFADPLHPAPLGDKLPEIAGGVNTIRFTPDGRTMILVNGPKIQVWDIGDRTHIRPISAPIVADSLSAGRISFSPDSRRAVITGENGRITLWDLTDRARPQQIGDPLTLPREGDDDWTAQFLPHGNHLVISGGGIRVWDLDVSRSIDRICDVTGSLLTEDLWQRHLPQLPYRPPCA
ncbi:NACHT and WD repeat domain-containing protein [Nocardia xishanensis]